METNLTSRILLIEDNPGDADLIEDLLDQAGSVQYKTVRATSIAEATQRLKEHRVDVVLLDLSLPDGTGIETVKSVRATSGDVPIVILTGTEDEALALACIDAGAQDYIWKGQMQKFSLLRSIGYAITRIREAQMRELQEMLSQYRALSSSSTGTKVTTTLSGTGSVQDRHPQVFNELVRKYFDLLHIYLDQSILKKEKPREQMERLVTQLGDAGGGPRDLIDIHVSALDNAVDRHGAERVRSLAVEGRLLAVEMMGLLVDFYRVGHRRFL